MGSLSAVVLVAGGFLGFLLITKEPGQSLTDRLGEVIHQAPTCPLTGVEPRGDVPDRPALAIKIENNPDARPQAGLNDADIVYEEEAEGGISRFMAIYQCTDSDRIGPVRSARPVDPRILVQFGRPLFAYAGGAPKVRHLIEQAHSVVDLSYTVKRAADAYERDPNRSAPHDLFTSTEGLYSAAENSGAPPEAVFTYAEETPKGAKRAPEIHVDISPTADVFWRWARRQGVWLRSHGDVPHTLEDGSQVSATNVVVQIVKRVNTGIIDPAGNPVYDFDVVGGGTAFVFRDGRVIKGRWERDSEEDLTQFVTRGGDEIALAPGRTWVELYASDRPAVEF